MFTTYNNMQKKSETELISLSIRESVDSSVVKGLLHKINAIEDLLSITMQELEEVEGMESGTAEQFIAGMELAKRIYNSPSRYSERMNSPQDIAAFLMPQMRFLDREHFKCLYLNRKNRLICAENVSVGGLHSSIVHPREVFKPALKRSAASIILAHNHPSGDPTPSQEDINITNRLMEAGVILGISILDHLIIGDNKWVSLKQSGYMS